MIFTPKASGPSRPEPPTHPEVATTPLRWALPTLDGILTHHMAAPGEHDEAILGIETVDARARDDRDFHQLGVGRLKGAGGCLRGGALV